LLQHHAVLDSELREKIVGSLSLLRRKGCISSPYLLTTLFPVLVATHSKGMRELLSQKILTDLRNSNKKAQNHELNRTVQKIMYNLVTSDRTSPKAIWAVRITRELWRRQVWTDEKPLNVMKEACLAEHERVVAGAVRFFLQSDKDREEADDESSDEEAPDLKKLKHQQKINKKSKKQTKAYEKAVEKVKKADKKKTQHQMLNFSALHKLSGHQEFAENLFNKHLLNSRTRLSLATRLMILQLITRLVGIEKLIVERLYSWFLKHLTPKQESVSTFLACLAQATHNQVPPDELEPLLRKIANEFVSEASSAEAAAAGLNAVREICTRQPLAMPEELLQDLVMYRKSKDKGVMMAAKGLLSLFRVVAPELLERKDRGKEATIGLRSGEVVQRKFGQEEVGGIQGLELLGKWKEEQKQRKREENGTINVQDGDEDGGEDEYNSSDWEVGSDDSSDSGDWIRVSDSEDEAPPLKRAKNSASTEPLDDEDKENAEAAAAKALELATTTILTQADHMKLKELRMDASVDKMLGTRRQQQKLTDARNAEDGVTAEQIELPAKLRKTTKEERVAMAQEGKPDREEHKSTHAIRKAKKEAAGKSSTNKDKAKKKNRMMTLGKARQKQKRSLVQTRQVLKAHVERSKKGGRRGNFS
jgi:protein SDA1